MINIVKGVGSSLGFTLVLLFIFSLILTYTNTSEELISPVIIVLTGISLLLGSSIGNSQLKKNGILNGSIIGCIYFLVMYLISSIIKMDFSVNVQMIIIVIVGIICGGLGGIIGVNKK
ncbi:MAG: TIGR04086 family membrane protein [Clostridia bacterium]|nr:TIGR04086 family membrane protein [Clostridia bacterium]